METQPGWNKIALAPDIDFPEGFIMPVDKPLGWTSFDLVRKVKGILRHLGYKKIKIGHAGTLDPLATGVLVICIGRATKQVEMLQSEEKEYVAEVMLGATTPSYDLEHPIDQVYPYEHITRERVEEVLASMIGEQMQLPPVFSAKLIDGKRAYEHARRGAEVEMRRSLIHIYAMEIVSYELPHLTLRIRCSKGTYIRAIARDLGEQLGSGGHLTALRRTRSGGFRVEDAYTVDEIVKNLSMVKQN